VNLFKEIFEIDDNIYICRQYLFLVHHLTPFGVFVMEINLSDESDANENDVDNRKFFDYIAVGNEYFVMLNSFTIFFIS
jgi:hypothetical protein